MNGVVVRRGADPIPDGAEVTVLPRDRTESEPASPAPILFEDEHLIVVDKPVRLLTVAARAEARPSLWSALRKVLHARRPPEDVHLVHRLDEAASGLLVFAKTERVKAALKSLFRTHEIDRHYAVIVEGRPAPPEGEFRSRIVERNDPRHRVRSLRGRGAGPAGSRTREAVTRYRVLRTTGGLSAVEVRLETGRKHQIRVHFSQAGHPVLGDVLYGGRGAERLFLHAWVLGFVHPLTGKPVRVVSPPGREFTEKFRGAFDTASIPVGR